jgi:hypothetical protein
LGGHPAITQEPSGSGQCLPDVWKDTVPIPSMSRCLMCGIMRCPSPPRACARCVGECGAHPLHRLMPDMWVKALPTSSTDGCLMCEVMLCPSRYRLLETTVSALRQEPLRRGRPVIVGTDKPHPGNEDRGARYRMTIQPAGRTRCPSPPRADAQCVG